MKTAVELILWNRYQIVLQNPEHKIYGVIHSLNVQIGSISHFRASNVQCHPLIERDRESKSKKPDHRNVEIPVPNRRHLQPLWVWTHWLEPQGSTPSISCDFAITGCSLSAAESLETESRNHERPSVVIESLSHFESASPEPLYAKTM